MKTQEELNILWNEIETLGNKLAELSDDELKEVFGGSDRPFEPGSRYRERWINNDQE